MQKLPMYIFETEAELGIHKIPNGSVIVVTDYNGTGKSIQTMKRSGTGLTSSSTVGDFLSNDALFESYIPTPPQIGNQGKWLKTNGLTASWEEVFSYDEASETLTINL